VQINEAKALALHEVGEGEPVDLHVPQHTANNSEGQGTMLIFA
jgi:hypothetical protein